MAAKFLCCLPLRLGVIVISFLQFLLTSAVAGLLWWALWYADKNDLATVTNSMRTTAIIVASIYTAAALVGLLGFFGAVFRKHGFIKTFYILLCAVFGFQIGGGVWYLVTFYRSRSQTLEDCIDGSSDQDRIVYCQSLKRIPQGFLIASVVIPILVVGYACYIVHQYSRRLEQQKTEKLRASLMPTTNPVYQPVPHGDEYQLTQQYPYAAPTNAFGHNRGSSYPENKV